MIMAILRAAFQELSLAPRAAKDFKCLTSPRLSNPKALRTHVLRLLGPKTILHEAVGRF